MAHCIVPEAEKILDKEFKVLDKGFVRLVDYLGGDSRIVQSARVSYGEGTKTVSQDAGLIDYLMRHDHTSPFEQVVLTFHLKMPIFVARQWVRHRTARMNEVSGRYSIMPEEFYVPDASHIAPQSSDNKQGRSNEPFSATDAAEISGALVAGQEAAYKNYSALIDKGVARELARINLPLSLYTEFYWQIDLHNLFHFLKLRLDSHAQYEIRAFAEVLLEVTRAVAPLATKSFENNSVNSVTFNGEEMAELKKILEGKENSLTGKKRERFDEKIKTGKQL